MLKILHNYFLNVILKKRHLIIRFKIFYCQEIRILHKVTDTDMVIMVIMGITAIQALVVTLQAAIAAPNLAHIWVRNQFKKIVFGRSISTRFINKIEFRIEYM